MNTANYIISNLYGKILRKGTCNKSALGNQIIGEDEYLIEGDGFQDSWVVDGKLLPLPRRPSEFHDFDYARKQWVANPEAAWASVKQQRARLLAGSDWMVTKAAESGQTVPPEWVAYRQALRDITLQADPWAIVWPVAP